MGAPTGSHFGSDLGSHVGVANGTPTYGTYGTDGESGCERANPYVSDRAHEQKPRSLAYATPCRYCGSEVYVAICRDGRWRSFEKDLCDPAPHNVWAWRKRHGMEEQDLVRGYHLHFCAEYGHVKHTVGAIR
jgi:hypothetical protein